ncbi:hypothetical protein HMPREF3207_04081 [Citrobacter koseri]|nr:hypothetical protein HMPREF3207_04081 [Citrobacter koseri]
MIQKKAPERCFFHFCIPTGKETSTPSSGTKQRLMALRLSGPQICSRDSVGRIRRFASPSGIKQRLMALRLLGLQICTCDSVGRIRRFASPSGTKQRLMALHSSNLQIRARRRNWKASRIFMCILHSQRENHGICAE